MNIYAKLSIGWVLLCISATFIKLRMNRDEPEEGRGLDIVPIVLALVAGVFIISFYQYMTPQTITEEWMVFESYESKGQTFVLTWGHDKRSFRGQHEFDEGATYEVTWRFARFAGSSTKYGMNVIMLNQTLVEAPQ